MNRELVTIHCPQCDCTVVVLKNSDWGKFIPDAGGTMAVSKEACNCTCHTGIGLLPRMHITFSEAGAP